MKYDVKRQHYGDRLYIEGDVREANPADVAELVARGILAEKSTAVPKNKAKAVPKNKARK